MKFIPLVVIIILVSLFFNSANAATGCLSNSTTYTYINPEGVNRNGVPSYFHRYESDRMMSSATYCAVNTGAGCYIYSTRQGYSSSPGTIVQFNLVDQCPIDDYAGVLMISFAAIGCFYIKKTKLPSSK